MRTPAYHPLESPLHYVLRLSEANGYHKPAIVIRLAEGGSDRPLLARWDYTHLNALLPACRQIPSTFTYRWPGSRYKCDLSLLGKHVQSRHLGAPSAGVCADCIRELGFAPAWWDIKYAVACPKHHCTLVHSCPACGKRLSYQRRGLLVCSCGTSLVSKANMEPSAALLWLMELLRRKTTTIQEAAATLTSRPLTPEDLSLNTLCRVIEKVGFAARRMSGPEGASPTFEARYKCLSSAASFLYHWPHGVSAFCTQWDAHVKSMYNNCRKFRSVFAWAYRGLFQNLGSQRGELLFLMDAVLRYEQTRQGGSPIDVRSRDLKQLSLSDGAYCSLSKSAELSGIPYYTLRRLVRKKQVQFRTRWRGRRSPAYEIETEIARDLRLEYHDARTYRLASRYLGVTYHLYQDLRRCGMIQKRRKTMLQGIAVSDLTDFKESVFAKAHTRADVGALKSLYMLRRSKCPHAAMVKIVKGILDGSIPCFRPPGISSRIDDLFVCPSDVDSLIAECTSFRIRNHKQLRARYVLSYNEASTLTRYLSDRVNAKGRISPRCVNQDEFDEFMSRYRGLTAYAQEQGTSQYAMLGRLRRSRVALLAIPLPNRFRRFAYFISKAVTYPEQYKILASPRSSAPSDQKGNISSLANTS